MSEQKTDTAMTLGTWIEERVCRPSLEYVPRSIAPNSISLTNVVVCWMVFGGAAISPVLSPGTRVAVLAVTGLLMFTSMVLDCWDGMQARRTGRTSKLGELLDHWLDSIHVPLVTAAMALMLGLPPWIAVVNHVSNAMIYNAQLVVYHEKGRFVAPETSGVQAQFWVSIGIVATGVLFYVFPRETPWIGWLVSGIGLLATFIQLKQCWFFYEQLTSKEMRGHWPLVAYGLAFGVLFLVGAMNALAFVLVVVFVSFRLSGSYVLFTIVKKRFNGNDLVLPLFIVAIGAAHFLGVPPILTREMAEAGVAGYPMAQALAFAACAYVALRNLWDLSRHFEALKPAPRALAS